MVLNSLKDSVKKRNISEIRSIFFTIFSQKPSSKKITENLNYCFDNGISKSELFVSHDGEEFSQNIIEWNLDYYTKQVGKIQNNFSKERIDQLLKMADYLFTKEKKQNNSTSISSNDMVLNSLKDSVKKRNISEIRSIFFTIFSQKPSSKKITENLNYCFDNGISKSELFVSHDGEEFSQNIIEWNLDYYTKQVGKIQNNFSKERIDQLLKMADYLFAKEKKQNNDVSKDKKNNILIYVAVGVVATLLVFLLGNYDE